MHIQIQFICFALLSARADGFLVLFAFFPPFLLWSGASIESFGSVVKGKFENNVRNIVQMNSILFVHVLFMSYLQSCYTNEEFEVWFETFKLNEAGRIAYFHLFSRELWQNPMKTPPINGTILRYRNQVPAWK